MEEASASLKAMRPRLTTGWVGSSRAMVAVTMGAAGLLKSTTETLLSKAFNTHAICAAPAVLEASATPRGPAPTATRPNTAPDSASTVNTLSEPAAVATKVRSSSLTWMPKGVARAMPGAGWTGGKGSKSKKVRALHSVLQSKRVI